MSTTEKYVSERSTVHSTFVIERTYPASPERVFAAWSDQAAKAQWFGPGEKHAEAVGETTRLTLTEQGVFLDGLDTPAEREHGTKALLDALGSHLLSSEQD